MKRTRARVSILLVDDDDQLRGLYRNYLAAHASRVLEAHNGLEALLMALQHEGTIDLVIIDLVMPGIGGAELGRAFNEMWPQVNVLYMSGSPREAVGAELPADCVFLQKPFGTEALEKAVGTCIQSLEKFRI